MLFSMDQCYGWHSSSTITWLTCKILTAPKFYSCKIEIAESEGCSLSLELDANLIEAQFHLQSKWMLLDWCSLNYVHNICLYWKHHILYVLDCSGSDLASRRIFILNLRLSMTPAWVVWILNFSILSQEREICRKVTP